METLIATISRLGLPVGSGSFGRTYVACPETVVFIVKEFNFALLAELGAT